MVHHQVFKADHTYHAHKDEDKNTIPMAWWNAIVLIPVAGLPWIAAGLYTSFWSVIIVPLLIIAGYYGAYERIHWCFHLPKKRNIERTGIYFRLNGHHLLHHRYMHRNFNVVLPFADLCLGTLRLRSKTKFAQARGLGVPCVQPRAKRQRSLIRVLLRFVRRWAFA